MTLSKGWSLLKTLGSLLVIVTVPHTVSCMIRLDGHLWLREVISIGVHLFIKPLPENCSFKFTQLTPFPSFQD